MTALRINIARTVFSYILILFILCIVSDKAFSQNTPNLHIGALEVHPFASLKQTYDTNIYLESKGEETKDFITDTVLGTSIKMPIIPEREEDFTLEGVYEADIVEFWDQTHRNRVDHMLSGKLDLNFSNDFQWKTTEYFKKTASPPNSERTTLDKRYSNILNTEVSYNREKITTTGAYTLTRDAYDESRLDNLNTLDNTFTGAVFYKIFPKTSIFGEYNFGVTTYDNNNTNSDSKKNQGEIGLVGDLLPKTTGTVKAGYRNVSYDESDKSDFSGLTLFGNIKYDMSERTIINLSGTRTSEESSYGTNSYFEMNKLQLKVDHQLLDRLWMNNSGFIQYNKYPVQTTEAEVTGIRKDALWGIDAGLKYELKEWMIISGGYEFKQRDSRFDSLDYNDHKITAKVTAKF
ncbi:MAG: outer membrane beta-barrel protein [Candidatus Omnitrophica bacterium]|nr:outer membrane beta-barrel protein [Candidatus Omnitrophota bacterium]